MTTDDTHANQDQATYWQEQAGPRWAEHADPMDRRISHLGTAAMDLLQLNPGLDVLDVGCGCGGTTFDLARRVGPSGTVLGADISNVMLDVARSRAAEQAISNVAFDQADVQTKLFDRTFDAIFSRFGVMFFNDPDQAFANLGRVLKPAGQLAFVCWRLPKHNPWLSVPMNAVGEIIELPEPPEPGSPGPFAFGDSDRLTRILTNAGFREVQCELHESSMQLGDDIPAATQFFFELGPLAELLAEHEDAVKDRCITALQEALVPFLAADGVKLPTSTWLVSARR